MANLRIVTDNAVGRAVSLVASSTAGGLAAANLQVDRKSSVWRASGKVAGVAARWDAVEEIGAVALPFCNLSPTALIRVRASKEMATTNRVTGSHTLAAAHGWIGSSVLATTVRFKGEVPYVEVKKVTSGANEHRTASFGAVVVNGLITFTLALRAGASKNASVGLLSIGGSSDWGANASANARILEGPGSLAQAAGGLFHLYDLSTTVDTVLKISRVYSEASNGSVVIYPGGNVSTVIGNSVLVSRLQVEYGSESTSYYPTTASAATRPAGYIDSWQGYDYDSGWTPACPAPALRPRGFTPAQAASAYVYGGGACALHWLSAAMRAHGVAIDINDPDNLQGYVEAACLVAGPVWSPRYNASAATVTVVDRTELSRGAGGDQLADPGTISRKVPVDLRAMPNEDRAAFLNVVRNSRAYPVLLSVFPGHADLALERDFTVYGRRTKDSDIAYQYAGAYSTTLEIEEI